MYQEDLRVNLKDVGEVSARYCLIDVDGRLQRKDNDPDNKPIVVVGGLHNDLASMESFLLSLGVMGRTVIMIGHPGSAMGELNQEWVKRQQTDKSYSLDAQFFKQAISQVIGKNREIQLIGHSYGGPVVAEMLGDQSFSTQVTEAAIICPAGSVNQGEARMKLGIIGELSYMLFPKHLARYLLITGKRSSVVLQEGQQDELKKDDYDAQLFRAAQKNISLQNMKIKDRGTLLIVNAERDQITQSAANESDQIKFAEGKKNFKVRVITLQKEPHSFPLIKPLAVARFILEKWKNPGLNIAMKEDLPRFSIADWARQHISSA
jgi:pimeloyl-ACP methyl ester carboxylesterase